MRLSVKQLFVRDSLFVAAGVISSSLLVPQAWSLAESLSSPEQSQSVPQELPLKDRPLSSVQDGFRPVPANRMQSAKESTDKKRNPFAVDSAFASNNPSGNTSMMSTGLNSLRLTGIVREGSSLKALVEAGSEYASLALGDRLSLGVAQGLGFRVSAISFEKGNIAITNGREEREISIQP